MVNFLNGQHILTTILISRASAANISKKKKSNAPLTPSLFKENKFLAAILAGRRIRGILSQQSRNSGREELVSGPAKLSVRVLYGAGVHRYTDLSPGVDCSPARQHQVRPIRLASGLHHRNNPQLLSFYCFRFSGVQKGIYVSPENAAPPIEDATQNNSCRIFLKAPLNRRQLLIILRETDFYIVSKQVRSQPTAICFYKFCLHGQNLNRYVY